MATTELVENSEKFHHIVRRVGTTLLYGRSSPTPKFNTDFLNIDYSQYLSYYSCYTNNSRLKRESHTQTIYIDYCIMNKTGEVGLIIYIIAPKTETGPVYFVIQQLRIVPRTRTDLHRLEQPRFISYLVIEKFEQLTIWPIKSFLRKAAVHIDDSNKIRHVSILPNNCERF